VRMRERRSEMDTVQARGQQSMSALYSLSHVQTSKAQGSYHNGYPLVKHILCSRWSWVVMKRTHPLCGPAAMSQHDFTTSETMQPQETSPVTHPMSVLGIDM